MDNLIIEKTTSTPYINFDAQANKLTVAGESFPENAAKFYAPVLEWLTEYIAGVENQEVLAEMDIIYFNSSTSKILMLFFNALDNAAAAGKNITVNWRCDARNETAIECGEEFQEDLQNVPFNIVIYKGE
jgi:hypothetical protein